MSEHTPLPWIICESDVDPKTLLIAHLEHGAIAILENNPYSQIFDRGNGDLILRATNNHDRLTKVCRAMANRLQEVINHYTGCYVADEELIAQARATLALTELKARYQNTKRPRRTQPE